MNQTIPNQNILKVFGVTGELLPLAGGQGACFRVGNIVLKPTKDIVEASGIADIYDNLTSDKFRVPKPIRTRDGSWVFDGWTASLFVKGKHLEGRYAKAIEVSKIFHQTLSGLSKPIFLDQRNNIWSVADKIAWDELPLPDFGMTNEMLKKIFSLLRKNELPNQLIHGDWGTGNILFDDELAPAVIDFSPYWRPADFAIAIMMIDALVYENAKTAIIDLCQDIKDFDQLLLRALVRRICEYIGHQNHIENIKDFSEDIIKHLKLAEVIISYFK
jgi:uncharacterized protein (TIGR02569 family)